VHRIDSTVLEGRPEPIRARWSGLAVAGQVLWLCGNVYEGVVDMPRLLSDARAHRRPGLMSSGSPLRYYAAVAPLTVVATTASLVDAWRSGGDRRVIATAAVDMAVAAGLTAYLVREVNIPLLTGSGPSDGAAQRRMLRNWHRVNAARVAAVTGVWLAMRRMNRTQRRSSG
jgi:hypothetical protein